MSAQSVTRYQPCLIDRLADNQPGAKEEAGRARMVTPQAYEAALLRDLEWLLNCNAQIPVVEGEKNPLFDYPYAEQSVINFGVRQAVGQSAFEIQELERRIVHAIRTFEPRINPNTLSVKGRVEGNSVFCEIDAEYWAEPIPLRKLIKTKVDLETGNAEVLTGEERLRTGPNS
ncbi:MAG: GPW/gp25 family protein [Nibricoccus sp.]